MNLYVYKRISTKDQLEGTGLDQQVDEATLNHVQQKFNLANVVELESGIGLSGYHGSHLKEGEALRVFIDQCKSGDIPQGSILLIYSLDRISRMTGLTAITDVYAPIVQNGVKIYTKAEGQLFDDSDMSQLMATLLFQRSHNESKTKADRVNNAILAGVNKYLTTGERTPRLTKSPFWIDNTIMDFNEWEGAARYMVALRLEGKGYKTITSLLQNTYPRLPARKGSKGVSFWEQNKLTKWLNNVDMLRGHKVVTIKGESYKLENYYPSIITPEQALKLQNKPKGRTPSKPTNLLKSLCKPVCGDCGYPLNFMEKTKGNFQYFCSGSAKGKSDCKRNYVSCDFVDKWVLLSLTAIAHLYSKEESTDNQITTLKLEQTTLKNQLNDLTTVYNTSKSPTVLGLIVEAESELQKVTDDVNKLENNLTPTLPTIDQVMELYSNFDNHRNDIKLMFQALLDQVVVKKVELEEGHTFELIVKSGKYEFTQSITPDMSFKRLPKINVTLPDYELTDLDILHLTISYDAPYRLITDGYMFELFKNVSRRRDWQKYHRICIDRINARKGA